MGPLLPRQLKLPLLRYHISFDRCLYSYEYIPMMICDYLLAKTLHEFEIVLWILAVKIACVTLRYVIVMSFYSFYSSRLLLFSHHTDLETEHSNNKKPC